MVVPLVDSWSAIVPREFDNPNAVRVLRIPGNGTPAVRDAVIHDKDRLFIQRYDFCVRRCLFGESETPTDVDALLRILFIVIA